MPETDGELSFENGRSGVCRNATDNMTVMMTCEGGGHYLVIRVQEGEIDASRVIPRPRSGSGGLPSPMGYEGLKISGNCDGVF